MKKVLSVFLVSLFLITGCSSGGSGSSDKLTVGVVIYNYSDNFMSFVKSQLESSFAAHTDIEYTMVDAQNDQAKENDAVDNLLSQGVDVLAINLVDPSAGQAIVDKAGDVPVVFFNKEPNAKVLTDNKNVYYVGTTSAESGILQGELIADQYKDGVITDINGDGNIGFIMLKGEPGHPDAEARTTESVAAAKEGGVPLFQVAEEAAFWDTTQAKDKCDALFAANGKKIDVVIANNDGMALGCIASMKEQGVIVPIYGVDGLPDAIDKIKSGDLNGTVLNDPKNQAQATVDLCYNLAVGKDPLDGTEWVLDEVNAVRVPYVKITVDNTDVAEEAFGSK